jgi:hypothetical protein
VTGRGEARHVGADLGEQHVRGDGVDARNALEQLDLRAEGLELLIGLSVERIDVAVELRDVPQVHAQKESMVVGEPTLQGVGVRSPVVGSLDRGRAAPASSRDSFKWHSVCFPGARRALAPETNEPASWWRGVVDEQRTNRAEEL